MKTIEKAELNCFLELPLMASSFLKTDEEYTCIHDDNDGNLDQCLKIVLRKDSSGNEVILFRSPSSPGLRFRNYAGGGSSLPVHNALKVLIYASLKPEQEPFLPGFEPEKTSGAKILQNIDDILEGVIVLPPEVFVVRKGSLHFFFEISSHLNIAIAVDGDTHIITDLATKPEEQIEEETTRWNPEPFSFDLKTGCARALYNALILLAIATKESNR